MALTRLEREKITDSMLKIQSVRTVLADLQDDKVPDIQAIRGCLLSADRSLRRALREPYPEHQSN
jgi:hypothetical protein